MYRSMLDPYETTALWTIAGTDLKPQLGVLHYAPDSGLRVDLDWLPQEDASGWLRASSEKTVTVRGDRSIGSPLMLEDCAVVPDKGIPGYGCLKIHASIAFLGLDADDPASIQYTAASFTATQLSSWCDDLTGFVHPSESMSVEDDKWVATIRWKEPETIDVALPAATAHLGLAHTVSPGGRTGSISERPSIFIEFTEPRTREFVMQEYVHPLCDFYTLAATVACHLRSCTLQRTSEEGGNEASELDRDVEVLHIPASVDLPTRDRIPQEMLFTLADVKGSLASLVPEWLALHSENRFAMALYFSTRRVTSPYVERRFLSIAQACEALDQGIGQTRRDLDETRAFKGRVLEAAASLSTDDLARLKAALGHVGRISFREHILSFMDDESVVKRMIGIDPQSFADEVKQTRNFWTHGDTDSRWAIKGTRELHGLTEVLDYLFQDRLLREMGFDFDQRWDMFRRNFRFSNTRFRWW